GRYGFIARRRDKHVNFETHQLVGQSGEAFGLIIGRSILKDYVLTLNIAEGAEFLPKYLVAATWVRNRTGSEPSNLRYLRLLLRLSHSPTYCKCDRDGDNSPPFWILDFRLSEQEFGSRSKVFSFM